MNSRIDLGALLAHDNSTLATKVLSYCTMTDLGRFDLAVINHTLRPSLCLLYPQLSVDHLPKGLDKIQMTWLFERSINLTHITFAADLSMTDMAYILRQLNKGKTSVIKHVDVSRCGPHTTAALFSQLFNLCTRVENLNLSGCTNISKDNIHQLSLLCMTLKSLDLTDCDLVKTVGALVKGFPSLTHLSLARSSPGGKGNNMLKDSAVKAICQGCPALLSLDLSNCENTRDAALIALSRSFPALTSLDMSGCDKITDAAIRAITQNCPGLRCIELGVGHDYSGKVTDSSAIAISRNCAALTSFSVSRCYNITDAAAVVLSRGCPNLKNLDFTYCSRITNEGVIALSQGCPALMTLHLSKCTKVTGVAITALSQGCPLLTTLSVHSCAKISDPSLVALTENCKLLTYLDITNCIKVTDEAIIALATNSPSLTSLSLTGCDEVTNDALVILFQRCKSLKYLNSCPIDHELIRVQKEGNFGQNNKLPGV